MKLHFSGCTIEANKEERDSVVQVIHFIDEILEAGPDDNCFFIDPNCSDISLRANDLKEANCVLSELYAILQYKEENHEIS